ncbi:hypothetical protein MLD38_031869 [Melastoma candidum]|uniref:Uncharacterized protein n=1 Tax=Melastoma candidum TaxID=119954 RepID=A0ACB9MST3_9MYRT|nr:hypothetical protein MLD38_031869 [Melastoma candidum]
MAFLSKVGGILKQTTSRQINGDLSAAKPFIYQALRFMSSSKIFIGGLSYGTDEQGLREAFSKYGEVVDARVILDRETGRSRGFGFVTFVSNEEASSAIQALDGQDLHGRRVRVNYASERPPPRFQSSYGGGGGGYGGGGFGGGGSYGGSGYGGGNYSNDGSGQGYGGGGNFNSPGSYGGGGSAGGYGNDAGFGSGGSGGFGGSYTSVAGGAGGSENFTGESNFSSELDGVSGGQQFDHGAVGSTDNAAGGYEQDDSLNDKDVDDEPDDYAKRA